MSTGEDGQTAVIDSHLFHPIFLGGHFKSIFFTKYLDPVLQRRHSLLLTEAERAISSRDSFS